MSHGPSTKRRASEDDYQGPTPPDGGWGWVVAFSSFMIHIVTDGMTYSFGIFYLEFVHYFDSKKGETAWIVSILVGMTLCSGPISSAFVNRYGCRTVTIAGSILASACIIMSAFAQNVTTLYFTIGIGTGFGFGLIYLPAIVSVTVYFEKYRSLATGIAVCGSGLGTFIFAPLTGWLIDMYGWRGAMLIISGFVLNCIIFGALFRPLEDDPPPKDEIMLKSAKADPDLAITNNFNEIALPPKSILNGDAAAMKRPYSTGFLSMPKVSGKGVVGATAEHQNGIVSGRKLKSNDATRLALSQPLLLTSGTSSEPGATHFGSQSLRSRGPLHRRDIFYQGSLMNIPQYRSRNDLKNEESQLMERRASVSGQHYMASYRSDEIDDVDDAICGQCDPDTRETFAEMMDFSLFKDPIFILFTLSNFCTSIGFNVPYVYIVAKAETLKIDPIIAKYLLAIIGIANTIGRIVLGYLSDKPWINRLCVYNTCLTICGIATFFSAFCFDIWSLAVYASVFGFTIGAYVGLTSVILVDLLGLDKLTNAFGLLLLFQGIASFVGPPIAGSLYDYLGSYDPGFYMAGVAIAGSGLMLYAIPYLQIYLERRRAKRLCGSQNKEMALTQTI